MRTFLRTGRPSSAFVLWVDGRSNRSALLEPLRKVVKTLLITMKAFKGNDLSLRSAALTYTVLLSLVPILAMSTAVVKGLGGGDQLREIAYTYLDSLEQSHPSQAAPPPSGDGVEPADRQAASSSITGHLRQAVDTLFAYVDNTNFAALGSMGIAGVLISVLMVFGHIEQALNKIWKVATDRSLLRKVADYITIMVLMPISINIAFAASAFLKNRTLATKFGTFIPLYWLQALILQLVPVLFITITFFIIYIVFPSRRVNHLPALFGALVAALLWFGVQNVYITLQVGVANYNAIYGSFASLPLFLIWMYLAWLFVLSGAQIAYAAQHVDSYQLVPSEPLPSLRLSAAFDVMDRVQLAYRERTPVTVETVAESYPQYDEELVEGVIEDLNRANFLLLASDKNRLLPAAPPETIDKKEIIELILGKEVADTSGGKTSEQVMQAATGNVSEDDRKTASAGHAIQ